MAGKNIPHEIARAIQFAVLWVITVVIGGFLITFVLAMLARLNDGELIAGWWQMATLAALLVFLASYFAWRQVYRH